jgi:hypothetical protein
MPDFDKFCTDVEEALNREYNVSVDFAGGSSKADSQTRMYRVQGGKVFVIGGFFGADDSCYFTATPVRPSGHLTKDLAVRCDSAREAAAIVAASI